jgi:hypothetical protein
VEGFSVSESPLIFLCRTGDLSQPSKVALRKAGVLVVESKTPELCTLMSSMTKLSGDQISAAALKALCSHRAWTDSNQINTIGRAQSVFVQAMSDILNPPSPKTEAAIAKAQG